MAKQEIEEVAFRPAKGGIISETRTKTKRPGQGGGPSYDYDHDTEVHPSMEHAQAHLEAKLGDCFGGKREEPTGEPGEK
jgi:hypothetical protein